MYLANLETPRDVGQSLPTLEASHIPDAKLRYAICMILHSKIWAIGTLVVFLPLGAIVLAGVIPGAKHNLIAI